MVIHESQRVKTHMVKSYVRERQQINIYCTPVKCSYVERSFKLIEIKMTT